MEPQRVLTLQQMKPSDFQGFLSLRTAFNLLSKHKNSDGTFKSLEAAEAQEIVATHKLGRKEWAELISASDIGATTDVIDRQIIAAYRDTMNDPEQDLTQLCVKRPVNDFVFQTILFSDIENYSPRKSGGEGYDAAYIDVDSSNQELEFWGKLVHVDYKAWRSAVRGEILRELPTRLGVAGKRTIQRLIAQQIGATATRNLMYTVGNGNLFTRALTVDNLKYVLTQMKTKIDPYTNEPRGTIMAYLVVPQALEFTAKNIINPNLGTLAIASIDGNVIDFKLKLIVNPMLDRYTSTGWWLFGQPIGNQGPLVDAYLAGNDAPELFIQASDAQRISGNGPAEMGQFASENISWKGRITRKIYWLTDLAPLTAFSEPAS